MESKLRLAWIDLSGFIHIPRKHWEDSSLIVDRSLSFSLTLCFSFLFLISLSLASFIFFSSLSLLAGWAACLSVWVMMNSLHGHKGFHCQLARLAQLIHCKRPKSCSPCTMVLTLGCTILKLTLGQSLSDWHESVGLLAGSLSIHSLELFSLSAVSSCASISLNLGPLFAKNVLGLNRLVLDRQRVDIGHLDSKWERRALLFSVQCGPLAEVLLLPLEVSRELLLLRT